MAGRGRLLRGLTWAVGARGGAPGSPGRRSACAGLCVAVGRLRGMPVGLGGSRAQAQEAVPVPPVVMPLDFIMSAKSLVSAAGGASASTFTP